MMHEIERIGTELVVLRPAVAVAIFDLGSLAVKKVVFAVHEEDVEASIFGVAAEGTGITG
jgi:hypothetical protein